MDPTSLGERKGTGMASDIRAGKVPLGNSGADREAGMKTQDAIEDVGDARRVCDALNLDFGVTVLDGVQGISWDLAVKLLDRAESVEDKLDELEAEYERDKRDFEEAHSEIKCPECGCGVISDCEAAECGCDAPVCSRDGGKTLAEHYVSAIAEVERLRGALIRIFDDNFECGEHVRIAHEALTESQP